MYATFSGGVYRELIGNIEFSPTVFQTAESLTDEQRIEFGIYLVVDEQPILVQGNKWAGRYDYRISGDTLIRTWYQEPISAAEIAQRVGEKIEQLWRAADAYQSSQINGVAIGLLTIGVLQQRPKAMAIQAWTASIWDEYYRRKALLTYDGKVDTDFSAAGPMPHSVPELRVELGM